MSAAVLDPRRSTGAVVALLFLLGLAPRLWRLDAHSLWMDELSTLGLAALGFQELRHALTLESNMALYYWGMFAWLRLVGVGADEWLVRLPSTIVGAATVPLLYLLGKRLGSPAGGLAAALLLAVNPYHVAWSREARGYALLGALTVSSYLLLAGALRAGPRRAWALHGFVNALAFYCHFFAGFVFVAQGLFIVLRRSCRATVAGLACSGLVTATLIAPLLPVFLRGFGAGLSAMLGRPDFEDLKQLALLYGGATWPALAIYAVLVLATARPDGQADRARALLAWSWLLTPLVLVFGLSQAQPMFTHRYLFAILPGLTLLAGLGAARLPRPIGLSLLGAAAWLSLGPLASLDVRPTEHWRQAAAHATAAARPDDGWIFISKRGQNAFEYYAGWGWGRNSAAPYGHVLEPFDWHAVRRIGQYRGLQAPERLEPFAAAHPRIWLIVSHEQDQFTGADTAAPVRDWLGQHGYSMQRLKLEGIRVLLHERNGAN